MANKYVALKAPMVIQQPAVVLQTPDVTSKHELSAAPLAEETNSSTQAEASENQKIELNCREQARSEPHVNESYSQEQPPAQLSYTPTDSVQGLTCSTSLPNPSPKINPPDAPLLEEENPSQTRQPPDQSLTSAQHSDPCIRGDNSAVSTKSNLDNEEIRNNSDSTEKKPIRNTVERRILVRTVNAPVAVKTEQPVSDKKETGEIRPKIKIQANQVLIRENLPKIRVEVGESQSSVYKNLKQNTETETHKKYHTSNTVVRVKPGVRPGSTQDVNKSMNDIFGRREEARLKRRAERQAKLRAEAMSASRNNPPLSLTPSPSTQLMSSAKTMMSSLELRGLISPDISLSQRATHDVQRTTVLPSPTTLSQLSTGVHTPTDNIRSPVSDQSHSGFMKLDVPSITMKPGSFMHYHKDIPTPDSATKADPVELVEELENELVDLSESDPEAMEDVAQETPEESDKMEAEKSSCRDTSPSISSRTATATASPSRSSSYTASRGSRSGSWTKSSSQSAQSQSQSQRSRSRSRSHNSTSSSTTPTRERKTRRRRPRNTPSSPSMQSLSVSRSPTPTQNPRHSSKRKKGKVASDSPVPRKYKNSSTDEFDPDYAPFTEVPPEVRSSDAFYFVNPVVKDRERTPQSYSSRPHSDRYTHSRSSSARYSRSSYPQHSHPSHPSHGHNVFSYEHSSQRGSGSYRGNSYTQGSRSRYNHSGSYNTSPHKNYNSYPPHKSSYNNYSQPRGTYNSYSHPRGSYNSQQRGSYNPTHSRGGYANQYHQKRPSKYESDSGKPQKTDNSGFGAFYRKDDDQWAEKDHDRRNQRVESPSSNRTVPARLAGRLGPLPFMHYHKDDESDYWKEGDRGGGQPFQDRNFLKRWRTTSHSNSDEEYKLNLKIKDIIAKNEQILRRKIELEKDKMIHGVS